MEMSLKRIVGVHVAVVSNYKLVVGNQQDRIYTKLITKAAGSDTFDL